MVVDVETRGYGNQLIATFAFYPFDWSCARGFMDRDSFSFFLRVFVLFVIFVIL